MANREWKRNEPEHEDEESPPGDFISDDLREQTARFLDEVRRRLSRCEANAGPKLGPPKRRER
ncbi:MAG TPA: hypothetical protein VGQ68_09450 [Gaiellaceae bacterium]|jgi:hypothetical protein|nr:hypothetical protein [Gaiellaceae bacterium]